MLQKNIKDVGAMHFIYYINRSPVTSRSLSPPSNRLYHTCSHTCIYQLTINYCFWKIILNLCAISHKLL